MNQKKILISSCLLGLPCRYDSKPLQLSPDDKKKILKIKDQLIPVCPEQLGGLTTPREPAEIKGGDGFDVLNKKAYVVTEKGSNCTEQFIKGAETVLQLAKYFDADMMIGQKNSPSCSARLIYDGTFTGAKKKGVGVCTAYLNKNKIDIVDLDDL